MFKNNSGYRCDAQTAPKMPLEKWIISSAEKKKLDIGE